MKALTDADLSATIVIIRTQPLRIDQALERSLAHAAYHIGQVVYLAKLWVGDRWDSLSIPMGQSAAFNAKLAASKAAYSATAVLRRSAPWASSSGVRPQASASRRASAGDAGGAARVAGRHAGEVVRHDGSSRRSLSVGESPPLPAGTAWPVQLRIGRPLTYLACVISPFAVIAALPVVVARTTAVGRTPLFFYDAENQLWGFDPKDRGSWSVSSSIDRRRRSHRPLSAS